MEITYNILQDYINTALTISIAFIGIGFALFTLFYAFIGNKKDELKSLNEEIKKDNNSISILRRRNSAIKFINKMKSFNKYAIIIMFLSLFITLVLSVIKVGIQLISQIHYLYIFLFIVVLSISLFIILFILIYKMMRHYYQYTTN